MLLPLLDFSPPLLLCWPMVCLSLLGSSFLIFRYPPLCSTLLSLFLELWAFLQTDLSSNSCTSIPLLCPSIKCGVPWALSQAFLFLLYAISVTQMASIPFIWSTYLLSPRPVYLLTRSTILLGGFRGTLKSIYPNFQLSIPKSSSKILNLGKWL